MNEPTEDLKEESLVSHLIELRSRNNHKFKDLNNLLNEFKIRNK